MRAGENRDDSDVLATASSDSDDAQLSLLGTTTNEPRVTVECEGYAVMMEGGFYLLENATFARPSDESWLEAHSIEVFSCYVRAARRAQWWAPEAFVVPCRA